jgi:hypothetical protein
MCSKYILATVVSAACLLVACTPVPIRTSESAHSGPIAGPVVPVGKPEVRDLGPTNELVWNCGPGGGTLTKTPTKSVTSGYAVEWEVGGKIGTGVTIGEGFIPGGVGLTSSLEGRYAAQFGQGLQQGTGWQLPAQENTAVLYNLMWREEWQPGYVEVTLADKSIVKVNVRYRTGFQSDVVGKSLVSCEGGQQQPVATQPPRVPSAGSTGIQSFSEDDLNALLGVGNWRCIDGFPNSVSINSLPLNFVVRFPLTRVDARSGFYYEGDTVPETGYATGWLVMNLPNNQCLTSQPRVTQADINQLLGTGNWACLLQFPTGVLAKNTPPNFIVQSPAMFVDKDNVRYYKGMSVPSDGPATVWFPANIASECPQQ